MSDQFVSTIRNGAVWSGIGTFFIKVIGLCSILLVLHKLTLYEYGVVEITLTAVSLFNIFLLPGFGNTVVADMGVQRGLGNNENVRVLFRQFFRLQSILGIIAFCIVFFGSNVLAHYYNTNISILFKIASLTFLTSPFRTSMMTVFAVYFKFSSQSIYTVLEEGARLILIILLLYVFDARMYGVVLAAVCSQMIALVCMSPVFFKTYKLFSKASLASYKPCWNLLTQHGKWGIFSTYLGTLTQNVRVFIIKLFLGTESVALFAVASGLFSHTLSLLPLTSIISPMIPQYVTYKEKFYLFIEKALKYQLINAIVVFVLAFFVLPSVIVYLFPKYESAIPLFKVLLLAIIPLSVATVFTPIFYALKAQKNLFFSNTLKLISAVILLPIGVSLFGIVGIALEYVITPIIFMLERYRAIKKKLPDFRIHARDIVAFDQYDQMIIDSIGRYIRRK